MFVTKEYTTLMFSCFHVGIADHLWCSSSIADLQAIDMGFIQVWRRRPSLIRIFQRNLASEGFKSRMPSTVRVLVDQKLWCSGSRVTLQAIDRGSIPVRCRTYNDDRKSAVIFVTKEYTTLMFSLFHVGIAEHLWCGSSIADLQAIDMGLIQVWSKRPSLIRIFRGNLASQAFKSIMSPTVRLLVDQHFWCSGSRVTLQANDRGSIPVGCRSFRVSKLFSSVFHTGEILFPQFSFSSCTSWQASLIKW